MTGLWEGWGVKVWTLGDLVVCFSMKGFAPIVSEKKDGSQRRYFSRCAAITKDTKETKKAARGPVGHGGLRTPRFGEEKPQSTIFLPWC